MLNAVFYCDGGARPNPGFGGWGIHGYIFDVTNEPNKEVVKIPNQIYTNNGYFNKKDFDELATKKSNTKEVYPLKIINGHGSLSFAVTNNHCELKALINTLELIIKENIQYSLIYSDSSYAVNGINKNINKWFKNDWRDDYGEPIKNGDCWRLISKLLLTFKEKSIKFKLHWIKAHDGNYGNEQADQFATIGVINSKVNRITSEINILSSLEKEEKIIYDKHPFISFRKMFFITNKEDIYSGRYLLGDFGDAKEMYGKASSTGAISYIELSEPDEYLEYIKERQLTLSGAYVIAMAKIDKLLSNKTISEINKYNLNAVHKHHEHLNDLYSLNKESLTVEINPPGLIFDAFNEFDKLMFILDSYKIKSKNVTVKDITEEIYDIKIKENTKTKTVTQQYILKNHFKVGCTGFKASLLFQDNDNTIKENTINLICGIDIIDRNNLKRLEKVNPKISIVTWRDNTKTYRYATIIEAANNIGIWGGVYSNIHYIEKQNEPEKTKTI